MSVVLPKGAGGGEVVVAVVDGKRGGCKTAESLEDAIKKWYITPENRPRLPQGRQPALSRQEDGNRYLGISLSNVQHSSSTEGSDELKWV